MPRSKAKGKGQRTKDNGQGTTVSDHRPRTQGRVLMPEIVLIGAILRQAVQDARSADLRGANDKGQQLPTARDQHEARTLLGDRERLKLLVELVGADVDKVQPRLLRAAGLT